MIFLGVILVLLIGVLFFLEGSNVGIRDRNFDLSNGDNGSDVNLDEGAVGSGGGSGSGSGDIVFIGEDVVSVNVSEFECGFYFDEYGVCAGTCPAGECVSEGRSCYCKKT